MTFLLLAALILILVVAILSFVLLFVLGTIIILVIHLLYLLIRYLRHSAVIVYPFCQDLSFALNKRLTINP